MSVYQLITVIVVYAKSRDSTVHAEAHLFCDLFNKGEAY